MIPDTGDFVVADSSFYICFLHDIQNPELLHILLREFEFAMGQKVHWEICNCTNYDSIRNNEHIVVVTDMNFSEILRPFFSKYEIEKGEGEIVALAVLLHGLNRLHILILDDDAPREFVERNLNHMLPLMTGTVGFVGKCYYETHILEKAHSLQILSDIEHSNFRVSQEVISKVRSLIDGEFGIGNLYP